MIGAQAIVAFQRSDGTMEAYTSPITSYGTQLAKGNLSFVASDVSASYANNEMVVYATLELPFNTTSVHQVWQDGPLFGNIPGIHATTGPNLQSFGNLDFLSGKIAAATGAGINARARMRNVSSSDISFLIWVAGFGFLCNFYLFQHVLILCF